MTTAARRWIGAASKPAKAKQGTLQLWVGGSLRRRHRGTPYREWLDSQIARFKQANKGSDVKIRAVNGQQGLGGGQASGRLPGRSRRPT